MKIRPCTWQHMSVLTAAKTTKTAVTNNTNPRASFKQEKKENSEQRKRRQAKNKEEDKEEKARKKWSGNPSFLLFVLSVFFPRLTTQTRSTKHDRKCWQFQMSRFCLPLHKTGTSFAFFWIFRFFSFSFYKRYKTTGGRKQNVAVLLQTLKSLSLAHLLIVRMM